MRSTCLTVLGALVLMSAPASAQQQLGFSWSMNATSFSKQTGRRVAGYCPPGEPSRVWGTDTYTADSSICSAAVHAGVITAAKGGIVTIVMEPGRPTYEGTTRNGVTSVNWAEFADSYTFDRTNREAEIEWNTTAAGFDVDTPITVSCKGAARAADIWGTDMYTSDSSICTAAAHAGIISLSTGGRVKVTRGKGAGCYTGTTRNGVASKTYGTCVGSFTVSAPGAAPLAAGPGRQQAAQAPRYTAVASLTLTPATLSVRHGDTGTLDASAVDAGGKPLLSAAIKWQSSDPSKVSVAADGTVTAKDVGGPVTITAQSDSAKATATVTVTAIAKSVGSSYASSAYDLGSISFGSSKVYSDWFDTNGATDRWIQVFANAPACANGHPTYYFAIRLDGIPAGRNYDLVATSGGPGAVQSGDPGNATSKKTGNQSEEVRMPIACGLNQRVHIVVTRVSGLPSASPFALTVKLE